MKTFKIVDGDLVFNASGNLEMVYGKDEIAQSVEMILTTNKGEWFMNEEFGLEYSQITDKLQTKKDIEFALREAIFQEERIEEVEFNRVDTDHAKRQLVVDLEMRTVDGEVIRSEVIV